MKRIISLIILTALTAFAVGCSSQAEESFSPEWQQTDNNDFEGMTFVIATSSPDFGKFEENTVLTEETANHMKKIADMYNVNFEYIYDDESGMKFTKVMYSVAAGYKYADMIYSLSSRHMINNTDYYCPFSLFDNIDLTSDKWGIGDYKKAGVLYGETYGVCPMYWQGFLPSYYSALIYNRDLLRYFSINDPQEYVENKTWTWDIFENYIDTCTSNDPTKPVYSMNGNLSFISEMAVYSNGGDLVSDNGGILTLTLDSENSREALEWAVDFYKRNIKVTMTEAGDDWSTQIQPFSNGDLTFLIYPSWSGTSQTDGWPAREVESFGYLPFPLGPHGTEYVATIEATPTVSVPINTGDIDAAGFLIDRIFDYMDGYSADNVYDYIKHYYFHTDGDYEVYMGVVRSARFNYWMTFNSVVTGGGVIRGLASSLSTNSKTVSQALEEMLGKYQSAIDTWNAEIS